MDNTIKSIVDKLKEKPPRKFNDHVLLVDGLNMIIRSFSLIKTMNPDGAHIGGIVGFLRSLNYVTRIIGPTRVIVVWDGRGSRTNRTNMLAGYKGQRGDTRLVHWGAFDTKKEEVEALKAQSDIVKQYLDCLPVTSIEMDKLEADDIIAFLAKELSNNQKKSTIVSTDKDFLQLVDNYIEVFQPTTKKFFNASNIEEKLKVLPENYNIVKAITGDTSDNVPKVKGAGVKTLAKEFPKLKEEKVNLNYIYEKCEEELEKKKPKQIFSKIVADWDKVELNFKVMDLHKSLLSDKQKEIVFQKYIEPIPQLSIGVFMRQLEKDKIYEITKQTENWLETFRSLTLIQE